MKYIDISEFREQGYLFELNRMFLHPLGLALEIVKEDDGTMSLGGIWDCRDDPEGIAYQEDLLSPTKTQNIENIVAERYTPRTEALGYWIQPVDYQAE